MKLLSLNPYFKDMLSNDIGYQVCYVLHLQANWFQHFVVTNTAAATTTVDDDDMMMMMMMMMMMVRSDV